jgi:hypothetical protein
VAKKIPVDEMKELNDRLDYQDKRQEQIIWLIQGNPELQIEGLIPVLKRVDKDVQDMKAWRDEEALLKGKFDVKKVFTSFSVVWKFMVLISGIGGGSFGLFSLFKLIFE